MTLRPAKVRVLDAHLAGGLGSTVSLDVPGEFSSPEDFRAAIVGGRYARDYAKAWGSDLLINLRTVAYLAPATKLVWSLRNKPFFALPF